jgi:hypothetical protein
MMCRETGEKGRTTGQAGFGLTLNLATLMLWGAADCGLERSQSFRDGYRPVDVLVGFVDAPVKIGESFLYAVSS